MHSYGKSYGEHREFLELNLDQHRQLLQWCKEANLIYSSSVWDLTAAKEIASLNPPMIKIPSACNCDTTMIGWLCDNYSGEIHVSLGMSTHEEERRIVKLITDRGRLGDLVLYSCTSGYPVPFEDVCLREIERIKAAFPGVNHVGFSGHHLGIAVDIAALALGATVFERHFTLDRTWKGTDHAASLEPDGMRRLVRDIRHVGQAMTFKEQEILPLEAEQRKKLKRNIGG